MTKARLLEGTEHHGKWKDGRYISQRPGLSPQDVNIKFNPQQPNTEAQQAHQQEAKSALKEGNERVKAILADPEQRAAAEARFADYCAKYGNTYLTKRKRKTRKRRIEDFIRSEIMGGKPLPGPPLKGRERRGLRGVERGLEGFREV